MQDAARRRSGHANQGTRHRRTSSADRGDELGYAGGLCATCVTPVRSFRCADHAMLTDTEPVLRGGPALRTSRYSHRSFHETRARHALFTDIESTLRSGHASHAAAIHDARRAKQAAPAMHRPSLAKVEPVRRNSRASRERQRPACASHPRRIASWTPAPAPRPETRPPDPRACAARRYSCLTGARQEAGARHAKTYGESQRGSASGFAAAGPIRPSSDTRRPPSRNRPITS